MNCPICGKELIPLDLARAIRNPYDKDDPIADIPDFKKYHVIEISAITWAGWNTNSEYFLEEVRRVSPVIDRKIAFIDGCSIYIYELKLIAGDVFGCPR